MAIIQQFSSQIFAVFLSAMLHQYAFGMVCHKLAMKRSANCNAALIRCWLIL